MLKDKGVLALIKKKAAEQEGRASDQQWDMEEIVTYVSEWEGEGGVYMPLQHKV